VFQRQGGKGGFKKKKKWRLGGGNWQYRGNKPKQKKGSRSVYQPGKEKTHGPPLEASRKVCERGNGKSKNWSSKKG